MRVTGMVVLLGLLGAVPAWGQDAGGFEWEVGSVIGVSTPLPDPLERCASTGFHLGARGLRRVSRHWAVEAGVEILSEGVPPPCGYDVVLIPPPPPPANGTHFTSRWKDGEQLPAGVALGRVVYSPVRSTRSELRLQAGLGWLLGRPIPVPQAGVAGVFGGRRARFLLEGDLQLFGITRVRRLNEYRNSQVVSSLTLEDRQWFASPVIRAGVMIGVGARR